MPKTTILTCLLVFGSMAFSACSLTNRQSLNQQPELTYGEEVQEKMRNGNYEYMDDKQVTEEKKLVEPLSNDDKLETINKELDSVEILDEDFSDL